MNHRTIYLKVTNQLDYKTDMKQILEKQLISPFFGSGMYLHDLP